MLLMITVIVYSITSSSLPVLVLLPASYRWLLVSGCREISPTYNKVLGAGWSIF